MELRRRSLVKMGQAVQLEDGRIRVSKDLVANLERAEVTRVGKAMAADDIRRRKDRRICQRDTYWLHPARERPVRHDR